MPTTLNREGGGEPQDRGGGVERTEPQDRARSSAGRPLTVDRRAAFAAGAPKMSRRAIYAAVALVLVIGLGGTLADRIFTGVAPATTTTTPTTSVVPSVRPPASAGAKRLSAPMATFLGLVKLKRRPAPGISLTDAGTGHPVSLAGLQGHVVVLTFANAACNDICPVLASELHQVGSELGTPPVPVTFVTVNTDPLDPQTTGATILSQPTLSSLPNWQFLTGSVGQLNPVWKHYGISIAADRSTHVASHNEFLYVIAPDGTLAWRITPFANESTKGTFTLPAAEAARFARGVARVADYVAEGK